MPYLIGVEEKLSIYFQRDFKPKIIAADFVGL